MEYRTASISKVLAMHLDLYMRLAILEGGAQVPPQSWTRGPLDRGVVLAKQAFPDLDPIWISPGLQLFNAFCEAAYKAPGITKEDIEDILNNLLAGFTRSQRVIGGQLYDTGTKLVSDLPTKTAFKKAKWFIANHGRQRAMALMRSKRPTEELDLETPLDDVDLRDVVSDLAVDPEVWQWLWTIWNNKWANSPGRLKVLDLWLEDPSRTKTDIAVMLDLNKNTISGKPDPTYVVRVIGDAIELAAQLAKQGRIPPAIQRKFDLARLPEGKVAAKRLV